MRGINRRFLSDLTDGELSFFLQRVKNSRQELSLEIRGGYINLYYRGGNLLKITQRRDGYLFHFDSRYCLNKGDDSRYEQIAGLNTSSAAAFIAAFDLLVAEMDSWFSVHPKPEREYQHQLLVHNPSVVDIEYQVGNRMRLDMLMVRDSRLIIAENKYGLGAISGSAGLAKHYRDICTILTDSGLREELYASVENVIDCKNRLGLYSGTVNPLSRGKHEILFLLANYNPKSQSVVNELAGIELSIPTKVLFTAADEYIIDFNKAEDLFSA